MKYGMVITFESKAEAEKARKLLVEQTKVDTAPARKIGRIEFSATPRIEEYDEEYQSPVWYCP